MQEFPINEDLAGKIQKLKEKYDAMGQDLSSYLDGLLYA
ncbi:MAG: tryptophan 2,3-dioxygenase, partial [Bacteroidia bacterium]|nr:tryptophan 2,3-dioxygenase [Bacteroidia bacterium]